MQRFELKAKSWNRIANISARTYPNIIFSFLVPFDKKLKVRHQKLRWQSAAHPNRHHTSGSNAHAAMKTLMALLSLLLNNLL
jgi:hypothetical protein